VYYRSIIENPLSPMLLGEIPKQNRCRRFSDVSEFWKLVDKLWNISGKNMAGVPPFLFHECSIMFYKVSECR
jgi:hypothetical protein